MVEGMNGNVKDDGGGGGGTADDDNICRDFLRNVCRRGKRCKYRHPDDSDPGPQPVTQTKPDLTFCHDYQNGLCTRPMCRFIHCTCEDESYYLRTGDLPPHILDQAIRKGHLGDVTLNGDVPICKDYLTGECCRRRGGKCKFRHLSQREYEQEIYGTSLRELEQSGGQHYDPLPTPPEAEATPDPKRQRLEPPKVVMQVEMPREGEFLHLLDDLGREITPRDLRDFRDRERDRRGLEEILLLRKQMDGLKKENASLKKEVSDLRATNEFLLDQVTTLRLSKAGGTMTAVTVPTVSLASTIPVATSVQHLTAATTVQHLSAARLAQPMPITSDGSVVALPQGPPRPPPPPQAPQQAPQQSLAPPSQAVGVAPPGPAVVGSIGGVQVSLPQVSTVSLNPQIAPATSMTPSMPPPTAQTLAQTLPQAISLSGTTGHLVSYPIMTQPVLRPQLQ